MNHLSPDQVEQLKEIGAHLRQLRQEKSLSTEEIAAKTFISLRLLKALEEAELDQLPEPIFIQGFIRRYADVLELDGAALAQTFPITVLSVKADTFNQEVSQSVSRSLEPYVLYIPILLVVTVASGLLYLLNKPKTSQPELHLKNSPISQQQKH